MNRQPERPDAEAVERAFENVRGEAEELAEASASSSSELDEEAILRKFHEQLGTGPDVEASPPAPVDWRNPTPSSNRRRWILGASIAASLLLAFGARLTIFSKPETPELPETLGPGEVRCLSPRDGVRSYDRFLWDSESSPGTSYDLRIYAPDGELVLLVPSLSESSWSPTPSELKRLPERIRWTIVSKDPSSSELGSDSASAWLSSSP